MMILHKQAGKKSFIVEYTILGGAFGLAFPILASLIEISTHHLSFSWVSFLQVQRTNPLLWIIDSTPLFLGIYAYIAGNRQQKLQEQTDHLEELVEHRSKEIFRQKLFYEALVQNSPLAIATLDQNQKIISINPAFQNLFGYRQEEIMGKELDGLIANPDRPQEAYNITQEVWRGNAVHEFGKRKRKDGEMVDVEIFGEPIMVNNNRIGVLGLYRDITVEKQAQDALSASEERFRIMFSDSPVALRMEDLSPIKEWIEKNIGTNQRNLKEYIKEHPEDFEYLCAQAKIIDLNDSTLFMFGAKNKEELQSHLHSILSSESHEDVIDIFDALLDGETTLEKELVYKRIDGRKIYTITKLSIIPGYEHDWGKVLFSNMDITERKLAEERLTYISLHDIMTGIYNRAFFEEELARLSKSRSYPISVLVTDMDNLKSINDQHGHQAGDVALQTIAQIVKDCFRAEDIVARIGGDEIAVLLQGMNAEGAQKAKERIQECIREHNQENGTDIPLSLSIGCATAKQGDLLTDTFKIADTRMYQEKKEKKKNQ